MGDHPPENNEKAEYYRMKELTKKNNMILFLFSRKVTGEISRIEAGEIPSEILYGYMELKNNGWQVDISDNRHEGLFGKLNHMIKTYGINLINFSTIIRIKNSDVVIVKGDFSIMTTLVCRILGKKIIYKDSMFDIPTRFWKRWSAFINLRLASAVIAYSRHQADIWEKRFKLNKSAIKTMHYCIDTNFYPELKYDPANKSQAISVGRDPGRDYDCLSKASELNNIEVKLVTLSYLLSKKILNNRNIEVLQRIPYSDLFNLYENSVISIVPLSKGLNYPTGIRGTLESLAIGMPTIATRTPVLEEYFKDKEHLLYVDAEDEHALSSAMIELTENENLARTIAVGGKTKTRSCYNMEIYTKEFEDILVEVINS